MFPTTYNDLDRQVHCSISNKDLVKDGKRIFCDDERTATFGLRSRFTLDQIYQGCNGPQIPFDYTETKGDPRPSCG